VTTKVAQTANFSNDQTFNITGTKYGRTSIKHHSDLEYDGVPDRCASVVYNQITPGR